MDELKKNMLKSGICPHCYKTLVETSGDKKWVAIKDNEDGVFTHFPLEELVTNIDAPAFGTITCKDEIPPDLENDNFYWICFTCYEELNEEIKRRNDKDKDKPDDTPQEERWIQDLDDWR